MPAEFMCISSRLSRHGRGGRDGGEDVESMQIALSLLTSNSLQTDPWSNNFGWLIKMRGSTIWDRFSTRFSAV
jgi:hypothetical protein